MGEDRSHIIWSLFFCTQVGPCPIREFHWQIANVTPKLPQLLLSEEQGGKVSRTGSKKCFNSDETYYNQILCLFSIHSTAVPIMQYLSCRFLLGGHQMFTKMLDLFTATYPHSENKSDYQNDQMYDKNGDISA